MARASFYVIVLATLNRVPLMLVRLILFAVTLCAHTASHVHLHHRYQLVHWGEVI